MGLFDSLIFPCPFCGSLNEAQTKSGPSLLDEYYMEHDLPLWLMEDLNGQEEVCTKCKKRLKLVFDLDIKVKKKAVEPVDNLDYVELEYKKRLAKRKKKLK